MGAPIHREVLAWCREKREGRDHLEGCVCRNVDERRLAGLSERRLPRWRRLETLHVVHHDETWLAWSLCPRGSRPRACQLLMLT